QILNCCPESDHAGNVRCACLELIWNSVVQGFFERDGADHVPAALVWRHRFEQSPLSIHNAESRGAINLVARKDVKIAVQGLYIHREMWNGLCAVNNDGGALGVRQFYEAAKGIYGPKSI